MYRKFFILVPMIFVIVILLLFDSPSGAVPGRPDEDVIYGSYWQTRSTFWDDAYGVELRGGYIKSINEYKSALFKVTTPLWRGRLYSRIGRAYIYLSQYDNALKYLNQGLEQSILGGDKLIEGLTMLGIGQVYQELGEYKKATEYIQKAIPILMKIDEPGKQSLALRCLGMTYLEMGQYEDALDYLERSLAIANKVNQKREAALAMAQIGFAYRIVSQFDRSLDYLRRSLALIREVGDVDSEGRILNATASVYLSLRQYEQAAEQCRKSLASSKRIGARRGEASSLFLLGNVSREMAMYNEADEYYQQALTIQREIKSRADEGKTLANQGLLYLRASEAQKALASFESALRISLEIKSPAIQWSALYGLAGAKASLGDYAGGTASFDEALNIIEELRSGFSDRVNRMGFMSDKVKVYQEFIKMLQQLHQKDPSKNYDRKALEVFERMQGRIMLEEVGRSGARSFSGLPDTVKAREEELEKRILAIRTALSNEFSMIPEDRNIDQVRKFENHIEELKAEYKTLQEEIKNSYPDYYALKYPKPASIAELQARTLRPGETVIVYFVSDESTCLWLISKDSFRLMTLNVSSKELAQRVDNIRDQIESIIGPDGRVKLSNVKESLAHLQTDGTRLCDLLLPKEARKMIEKSPMLYVVPTGPLYLLPFEVLAVAGESGRAKPRYLIEDHSISYISSITLLKIIREAASRRASIAKYPLLAFANPVYGTKDARNKSGNDSTASRRSIPDDRAYSFSLLRETFYRDAIGGSISELPETEEEVRKIAQILSAQNAGEPLQLREAASRSNIFRMNTDKKLDQYRYLVIACHGVLPGEVDTVRQPALVLSHPDPKTSMEGFLTVADVYGLKLNADLVTLSACNTGIGRIEAGEGVIGLTRAFMYAGTPAVSVTLWSVGSQSAKTLSIGHYENLNSGKSRAQALREIKMRMIEGKEGDFYVHPFFWAPVVIFGDGQ